MLPEDEERFGEEAVAGIAIVHVVEADSIPNAPVGDEEVRAEVEDSKKGVAVAVPRERADVGGVHSRSREAVEDKLPILMVVEDNTPDALAAAELTVMDMVLVVIVQGRAFDRLLPFAFPHAVH